MVAFFGLGHNFNASEYPEKSLTKEYSELALTRKKLAFEVFFPLTLLPCDLKH